MYSPTTKPENKPKVPESSESQPKVPSISLPKGGGAIHGIGEKFSANPVTGTGSLSIPIFTSPGRSGFSPQLSLSYDSGSGNGPFGFGWNLSLPSITRKTDKCLPKYQDAVESDVFILSGSEDLVPSIETADPRTIGNVTYNIKLYRPRIEGLFARIERWTNSETGDIHWRSISKDNILTIYGRDKQSRISDPANESRIYSWLICESYDDKGNAILYEYKAENSDNIDFSQANERNRIRSSNRYLKRIKYGNRQPLLLDITKPSFRKVHTEQIDFSSTDWMFEVVFDYGEDHYRTLPLDNTKSESEQHRFIQASGPTDGIWSIRPDPFSTYRSGFEVRTYRRCQRVLMFHLFPELASEKIDGNSKPLLIPYLVRSTEFDYSDFDYLKPFEIVEELEYKGSTCFASFIQAVTQSGYVRDETQPVIKENCATYLTFIKKSLPPLEFEYSHIAVQEEIKEIDTESLENLPYGLDGIQYQWVDLDGEGISGILTEQAGAWFYKPNMGDGKFGPMEKIPTKPSLAALSSGHQQLLDLAGDGQLDLVLFEGSVQGFYERTLDQGWENFTSIKSIPNVNWKDPNLKFIDLDGDGHADILIAEDNVFTWYPSLAEEGFNRAEKVYQALDEEKGPHLVFYDGIQSIYLADMSGDGLTDLVRIRNGEVCYWPNLGYCRFGTKVTMDNSPRFDSFDLFDQKRIRLADVDGSGTNDIIYLKGNGVEIYFNKSGNSFSKVRKLANFPQIDNLSSLQVADLFGNGTACLIWSSPLSSNSGRQMRYIDLMGGQKPHLLIKSINNLGAETKIIYASSTKFYLKDKIKGKDWITRIPFPVHVVERVKNYDQISKNLFVTRYEYHHGYFDGIEREFRGFGMVEQWDTEEIGNANPEEIDNENTNWDITSFVPPVLTRTWFHTGIYLNRDRISNYFAGLIDGSDQSEYYREPAWRNNDTEAKKRLLDDTILPGGLTTEEEREACRALKGSMLRQEIYALDDTGKEEHPYTVTEQNFTIKLLQAQDGNRHAVFFTHAREVVSYHYERNPNDPRLTHTLTLKVDDFGNVLRSITVGYPRADVPERQPEQNETHLTLNLNRFANYDDDHDWRRDPDWRRIGMPVEAHTYEIVKPPATALRFTWDELYDLSAALVPLDETEPSLDMTIPYEQWDWRKHWDPKAEPGGLIKETTPEGLIKKKLPYTQLRLIEHIRTLYRPNDLGVSKSDVHVLLPLGTIESLALPGESYKLVYTPALVNEVYKGRVTDAMLEMEGHYVHSEGDTNWWIPSGRIFYSSNKNDIPEDELKFAKNHFFLPHRFCDPFGNNTILYYDSNEKDPLMNHDLLLKETHDALENTVTAENDYRVLQPMLITDPNGNRSAAAFDALGMVVGTALMGKLEDKPQKGDQLKTTFKADLTQDEINGFLENPKGPIAALLLDSATTRIIYDLTAYCREPNIKEKPPVFAAIIAREMHVSDLIRIEDLKIQVSFSYSDGFGREVQKKIQAESGPVPKRENRKIIVDANGQPVMTDYSISPRWVGSGWTVFNNKGKPVRQYEPFFTDSHQFEFETKIGVSHVLFYDPVERVIATLHPNGTFEKVVFDPWHQQTFDVNDTVAMDPRTDKDISGYVAGYFKQEAPNPDDWKTWLVQRGIDPFNLPPDNSTLDPEKKAAIRTLIHANTPTIAYFDSLGRTFLTVTHNKFRSRVNGGYKEVDEKYRIRIEFDIEGSQRAVRDEIKKDPNLPQDPQNLEERIVMLYDYDMLSNRIHQKSMEAGERWILNDVTGKPIRAWDSRGHNFRTEYDKLRRPVGQFVKGTYAKCSDPGTLISEVLFEKTEYGEGQAKDKELNLRTQVFKQFDGAGAVTNIEYDFKGNLLQSQRQLAKDYDKTIDWLVSPGLENETFSSSTTYDALNRPIELIAPHSDNGGKINKIHHIYNEANLLESVEANLQNAAEITTFVENIDYNAKGQRIKIVYGSGASHGNQNPEDDREGVTTTYTYDPLTFRLKNLLTIRDQKSYPDDCPSPPPEGTPNDWPGCQLQNLHYTYDPAGNITYIKDDAQQMIFFKGKWVEPSAEYTYDAFYRLIEATGREHLGQVKGAPQPHSYNDWPRVGLDWAANDGNLMGTYLECFLYDAAGNILKMKHRGCDPSHPGWTRSYSYNEESQIERGKKNNRLSSTAIGDAVDRYKYDEHGNIIYMPHLYNPNPANPDPNMHWDCKDQLHQVDTANSSPVYYTYDSTGLRVRKAFKNSPGLKEERIYLGGFEVFRQYNGGSAVTLERETLHIIVDKQCIALVEICTQGNDTGLEKLIRYQFGNHLGSAVLELDDKAQIISYEEFYSYGCTSYQAMVTEVSKRYRYIGKERDGESGLCYHKARYYAPWLERWINGDPIILKPSYELKGAMENINGDKIDYNTRKMEEKISLPPNYSTEKKKFNIRFSYGENVYSYSSNNPIRHSDPTGLAPENIGKELENQSFENRPLRPVPTNPNAPLDKNFTWQFPPVDIHLSPEIDKALGMLEKNMAPYTDPEKALKSFGIELGQYQWAPWTWDFSKNPIGELRGQTFNTPDELIKAVWKHTRGNVIKSLDLLYDQRQGFFASKNEIVRCAEHYFFARYRIISKYPEGYVRAEVHFYSLLKKSDFLRGLFSIGPYLATKPSDLEILYGLKGVEDEADPFSYNKTPSTVLPPIIYFK